MNSAFRKSLTAALAALLTLASPALAQAPQQALSVTTLPQTDVPVQSAADAFAQDGAVYASANGVPLAEAERRLRAQEETVAATDRIQQLYRDRLAGIAIEHHPEYRIVVLLTGNEPVADQAVSAGGLTVPIVFHTGAAATRDQLVAAIKQYQSAIRAALIHPPGMGVDPRTGELVIVISGSDADLYGAATLTSQFETLTGVPVRIRAIDRPGIDLAAEGGAAEGGAVEGGARVVGVNPADGQRYACTTGFVVTDGAPINPRTAIVTAAHCPDDLSFVGPDRRETPLRFAGQWGWGYQDVQVNISPDPLPPLFYADSGKTVARPVTGRRALSSTRAGDVVCHRGERTGYSCAQVELVDFAPAGDLCGGACLPTWVSVAGPTCRAGDSGAPVFNGTTAFGIVKGASYRGDGGCAFYFYMSTDYLPDGWSLLEQPPSTPAGAIGASAGNDGG